MRKKVNVPLVLQMENVECGAASLAMVLRYFGKKSISLEQLRVDCNVSRDGVNAKGIKRAAEKNGLVCRAYKKTPESIREIVPPAVIHWNMCHFVVYCGYKNGYYYINDPASGRLKIGENEFDSSFTGIALTFEKTEEFEKTADSQKGVFGGFTFNSVIEYAPVLIFSSLVFFVITVLSIIEPFFSSAYIDYVLLDGNTKNINIIAGAMFTVIMLSFLASFLYSGLNYEIEKFINIKLSIGFMEKIFKLPVNFFGQRTPGELANRQLGSFEMSYLVCRYISPIFFQIVLIAVYSAAVFVFNIYIGIIGIGAIALNIAAVLYSSGKMSTLSSLYNQNSGFYQGSVASSVSMMETIKSCACEEAVFSRLTGLSAANIVTGQKIALVNIISSGIFYIINLTVSVAVLVTGVYEILSGVFSVGIAVAVLGMIAAFLVPVGNVINSISNIFKFKSIAERTDDTMKYKDDDIFLDERENQTKFMDGSVRVENVGFRYNEYGSNIIENISFSVNKGGSVALAGGSGSGKSTMAKLIAGLYKECDGHIYYGNSEKNELLRDYFYSKVAVVSQSVHLYDGTLFDNITMWDNSVGYDDVVKACRTACLHDDIVLRKNAYYENISEEGRNFSGGQKQRIEIARALVKKPAIMILDEATSDLDTETEARVMKNIISLGITLIIIAHRLSTIRNCDEILVFNNGTVEERGTHSELIEKKGVYYRLVSNGGE
ncbi:MAG: cysteine peptidase family C39 domain-containing protein [Clostridia bacterium]|nr:cysteine peptidase family C39 domain-containing protein [Clostridia bacterium]